MRVWKLVLGVIFSGLTVAAPSQTYYSWSFPGRLPSPFDGLGAPGGLNNFGDTVGWCENSWEMGNERGFVTIGNRHFQIGDSDGYHTTEALSINTRRQVTGFTDQIDGAPHGFLWQSGTISALPQPGDAFGSIGTSINFNGTVAGYVTYDQNWTSTRAAIFQNGQCFLLPSLGGNSVAAQIDDGGHVVGTIADFNGTNRAFYWNGSRLFTLGTLGGDDSYAYAMSGPNVVGAARALDGHLHPVMYKKGKVIDLGLLPGDLDGWATSINSSGDIVGYCQASWFFSQAFLYHHGKMVTLDSIADDHGGPSPTFTYAAAINDRGQIFAGGSGGMLLTPRYR